MVITILAFANILIELFGLLPLDPTALWFIAVLKIMVLCISFGILVVSDKITISYNK